MSNGTANLADVVEFSGFLNTKEHKQDARVAAANFLKAGPANLATFKLLFNKLYTDKIVPSDRDDVLDIDRGILENLNAIDGKNAKLENTLYDELNYITAEITPVLRNRKPDDPLDLQRVILLDGDLSKADLSGARLDGFDPERMDFHGATLKANDSQGYADKWIHSAWWEASSINLEFLKNLEEKAPFNHATTYSRSIKFTLPEYCQRTADLGMFDTEHCPVRTK